MKIVFIAILLAVSYSNGQEDFIIEGTDNFVVTEINDYSFHFGSNWCGPSGSTVSIMYEYNRAAVREFGEPGETFCFIPPGETTCILIEFQSNFETFVNGEFTFGLIDNIDSRICSNIKKIIPTNIIRIGNGDPSCNGVYRYTVTVGEKVDTADSIIKFIGGQPPRFQIRDEVTSLDANTYEGYLGTTFQSTVVSTKTIRINATDIQGEPLGDIVWTFKAEGSSTETSLPGSLAGVTITSGGAGQSELEISGVTQVHIGEYIAVATNSHGSHRASAFVAQGAAPFITEGSGQSSSSSFRVGARRAGSVGETISIRAEDAQSDPSSTITWWYSRTQSGPFTAISSGGAYSISASSGPGNVGTDSTLTISNVQAGQLGYYIAVATNEFGTYSSRASLVGRAPRLIRGSGIATSGSDNIGAQFNGTLGSTIIIRAFDEVGFPDSSYRWQRVLASGLLQDITSGGRVQITSFISGGRPGSTLTITGVTQNDLGTYRATASNGLTPDDIAESLVGSGSTCGSSFSVTIVATGDQVESAGRLDTTNANSFSIIARDLAGVPHGTVSWSYSRIRNGPRSPPSSTFTSTSTPANRAGTISFNNLADAAYGYYYARITNQFGSSECDNCVGRQLAFLTGSGQIGQNFVIGIGDSLTITAQFSDGFPTGEITWSGPNGPITPTTPGYTIVQRFGVSTLTINSARDSTDFGQYTASSSNVFGSVTSTSTVSQSSVIVPPTIDKGNSLTIITDGNGRIGDSFQAPSGQLVTICATDLTGVEASTIQFSRIPPGGGTFVSVPNSPPFSINCQTNADGKTECCLSFTVGSNTYGTYRAQASNSAGSDAAFSVVGQPPRLDSRFTIMRVRAGESSTIEVGGEINIDEGGTLILSTTDLEGQPGRNFVWTYRNSPTGPFIPLPTTSNIREFATGNVGTLQISNIDRSMYGEYRVTANNEFGVSNQVRTIVGAPPIVRFSTGTETDGEGEIGQNFVIPKGRRLRITACVIGGYPPALANDFEFREQSVVLESVQQPAPNENCFIYEEGEFEITCGTTITARTENIFGISNEPSSSIVFPPPTIVEGTSTCSQGSTVNSAQIGSQLCLYGRNSFNITCSVERIIIPNFSFEWQLNGRAISSNGIYSISTPSTDRSVLTVSSANVDESGRYTCTVRSDCGETDAASTDVDVYEYTYTCNQNDVLVCSESLNGGPKRTVSNSICESLGLTRPECETCGWETSEWTQCSDTTCHRGRRSRTVECFCEGAAADETRCNRISPKPKSRVNCGQIGVRCNRPYEWKAYQFGSCSATCGESYRDRRVECVSSITGSEVSSVECVSLFEPARRNKCLTMPCNACMNRLPDSQCRVFISIVGSCNGYYVRQDCCQTCIDMGL